MKINRSKFMSVVRFGWRHWFTVLCVAFGLYMCFGGQYSVVNIMRLDAQENELTREIEKFKDSIEAYDERIKELSVESDLLEKVAREKMLMHKENEDLYLIDD